MASVFPFRAYRPKKNTVKKISCPPYDVIETDEARAAADGNPNSFLHVIRPEIDLPAGTAYDDERVYTKGAENLQNFINNEWLIHADEPAVYLYRLSHKNFSQTGLFCCVSVDEYDNETILKHELTRPSKEDDRTKHILSQKAHAEPVMLTYSDDSTIPSLQDEVTEHQKPLFDFKASDGVRHQLWEIPGHEQFVEAFKNIKRLYIADGHHRCKSASRAAHELKTGHTGGDENFNFFPAVIFPAEQMRILAYNRLIHNLPVKFAEKLYDRFEVTEEATPSPAEKGEISLYQNGKWLGAKLPEVENANAVEKLDVYRLQKFMLEPMLDITDPRRDKNISFVGGSRGTDELEQRVDSGQADLAISMYPTSINGLIDVTDEGSLMPPKSTWFEPKLRSGLLIHKF